VNHPLDNDVYFYLLVLDVEKILTNTRFVCCMGLWRGGVGLTPGNRKFT